MKHVIIGTAGHVDHGKTALIKALTGRETDTLKEEKDRGISINLGFTFFDLPSGKRAGIIDVPGHEKFIKNMLAGATSIDLVLLVIAADEGVMPQTLEHMHILQLLNIKKGIIVLSKIDLVDPEWLEMVEEDISENMKETFLEGSPIVRVSSKTKEGIGVLEVQIDEALKELTPKDLDGHFRLPIDRVFSVSGFGTVVTGTIISGAINEGEEIQLYPSKVISKVRGIQIHGKDVKKGEAGERCAINLSGIKVEDINRGDIISQPDVMEPSMIIDAKLFYLRSNEKSLQNRQRIRFYHETAEVMGRIIILGKDEIKPGEESYVQLRLENYITAQREDRFVIRSYSPMNTIGGGIVIEPNGQKCKNSDSSYISELNVKASGDLESILLSLVEKKSVEMPDKNALIKALGRNDGRINEILLSLQDSGKIIQLSSGDKTVYIGFDYFNNLIKETSKFLNEFHKSNPLKHGISKEELRMKVFPPNIKLKAYDALLSLLSVKNVLEIDKNYICIKEFKISYSKQQQNVKNQIVEIYKAADLAPPKTNEVAIQFTDKINFKMVMEAMQEAEELVKVSEEFLFLKEFYDQAKEKVYNFINENSSITAVQAKDLFGVSRKYAVALLEHFDNIKFTKRIEDKRVLY